MATDLAEIFADLRAEASRTSRTSRTSRNVPAAAADARTALSRLRPALDRLRDDGLDTGVSIDVDPDAFSRQADRVHWARLLAVTCDTLGRAIPAPESAGRLTDLADAAAVAATLHVDALTGGERWATVAAIARTAHVLTDAAAGGEQESPEVSRALIIAEASSSVLFQFASLDPPTVADNAALLRPVPNPSAALVSTDDAVLEASAALVHATRPGTGPHPISDILAIATAADTTCRFVEHAQGIAGDDRLAAAAREAAQAWLEVREKLAPFNDGSRRPQTGRPPAVEHALDLHRLLRSGQPEQPSWQQPTAVAANLTDRFATIGANLVAALDDAVACGQVMAYAADLPFRESRLHQFLQGRRGSGLTTADADDFGSARSSLLRALATTAGLSHHRHESRPESGLQPARGTGSSSHTRTSPIRTR